MKKGLLLFLSLVLLLTGYCAAAEETVIPYREAENIQPETTENNPVIEGESPLTGLPASGEGYTPILLPLDNSPEGYPLWGVGEASLLFQVPLSENGSTRLLALFGDDYPEQCGPIRSGRMTMLPLARSFHAVFAYAGVPPVGHETIDVRHWLTEWSFRKPTRHYDLMGNRFRERVTFAKEPQNLSAHVQELHQHLVERKLDFEVRSFLFTDVVLARGEAASQISLRFFHRDNTALENTASACSFAWTEEKGYVRTSEAGELTDRISGETVTFANIIVMRIGLEWTDDYPYYVSQMRGSGTAEIFQSGRYIQGSWVHATRPGRLIFLDENGQELTFQRGKSYIVLGDQRVVVSYQP